MATIKFPITVASIKVGEQPGYRPNVLFSKKCGAMVQVRPCSDNPENRTYLGILLGEIANAPFIQYRPETQELSVDMGWHNPAIYVPDLEKVVFGFESWWAVIRSKEDLRQITDEDISNVWYVKALKQLDKADAESETEPVNG